MSEQFVAGAAILWTAMCLLVFVAVTLDHNCKHLNCPHKAKE